MLMLFDWIVLLLGLVLYAITTDKPKVNEIGRMMFFAALLAICLAGRFPPLPHY